jgi:UDP-N-acetylmuramyl pentapeptide phosphotransferase/UDP-N-acetylglucosamine-1-phosphate transferase
MAIVLLAAGALVAVVALRSLGAVLAHDVLERENFRGRRLPTGAGLCAVLAVLAIESVRTIADPTTTAPRLLMVTTVLGFGLLGLLDDLLGDPGDRGIRGHVAAALQGRVTTGFVKLAGGAGLAIVVAAAAHGDGVLRTVVDGALIALAANLGNLLDRAPGRTAKWALVAAVPIAVVTGTGEVGSALAPVAGATIGLLPGDLRERYMLGDTGANAIGAALGTAAVLSIGPAARTIVAVVLLGFNLLSEVASFSRIIDAVPPLRAFDRAGRLAP